jgi:hypothetical protein
MVKKIISVTLFFCLFTSLFAVGTREKQAQIKLEKYSIHAIPLGSSLISDYVFINTDRIILAIGSTLFEYFISTSEQKPIPKPIYLSRRSIENIDRLTCDKARNAVHMILDEKMNGLTVYSYWILYLDGHRWEEFKWIENSIVDYYFDSDNAMIYIVDSNYRHSSIFLYDMDNHKYLDRIWFERDIQEILCIYGDPLKLLGRVYNSEEKTFHYYIFDIETRTGKYYSSPVNDKYFLTDYIALRYDCFLTINIQHRYVNDIMLLDLNNDTMENIILPPNFPYRIGLLKETEAEKYSFIIYGNGWQLLCITK